MYQGGRRPLVHQTPPKSFRALTLRALVYADYRDAWALGMLPETSLCDVETCAYLGGLSCAPASVGASGTRPKRGTARSTCA